MTDVVLLDASGTLSGSFRLNTGETFTQTGRHTHDRLPVQKGQTKDTHRGVGSHGTTGAATA